MSSIQISWPFFQPRRKMLTKRFVLRHFLWVLPFLISFMNWLAGTKTCTSLVLILLNVNMVFLITILILLKGMMNWSPTLRLSKQRLRLAIWKLKFLNYSRNLVILTLSILIQLTVPIQLMAKLLCPTCALKFFRFKSLALLTMRKNLLKWEPIFHVILVPQMLSI